MWRYKNLNSLIDLFWDSLELCHGLKIPASQAKSGDNCCRSGKCYEWNTDHSVRSLTTLWISVLVQKTNLLSVTTVHHRNRRNSEGLSKYRATKLVLFGSWYSSKQYAIFYNFKIQVTRANWVSWANRVGCTSASSWVYPRLQQWRGRGAVYRFLYTLSTLAAEWLRMAVTSGGHLVQLS